MSIADGPVERWDPAAALPPGETGEIVVAADVATPGYFRRPRHDAMSKLHGGGRVWHRMGDAGRVDEDGRIWFCGRRDQRVALAGETLYTVCCEAIFNRDPRVARTALVGVSKGGVDEAAAVVELAAGHRSTDRRVRGRIRRELLDVAAEHPTTRRIHRLYFHPAFPVDVRHNAKIRREELARWAQVRAERNGSRE
jgi:acyl-coenzyme A synthetase/AMP-(fatty) acid ligase